jgi:hypothetical protein
VYLEEQQVGAWRSKIGRCACAGPTLRVGHGGLPRAARNRRQCAFPIVASTPFDGGTPVCGGVLTPWAGRGRPGGLRVLWPAPTLGALAPCGDGGSVRGHRMRGKRGLTRVAADAAADVLCADGVLVVRSCSRTRFRYAANMQIALDTDP